MKHYAAKHTDKDRKEIEQTLLDCSEVYRWLRKDHQISKNALRKALKVRWCNIYQTFREPTKYMTLGMIISINDLLPDKNIRQIMSAITPEYNKEWWEISDWEEKELEEKLRKLEV